jgi:hypothetical protein
MSVVGQSRRFGRRPTTSGLPPETDIVRGGQHVSKVPYRSNCLLFDHFVGELLELQGNFEVKRLRGL